MSELQVLQLNETLAVSEVCAAVEAGDFPEELLLITVPTGEPAAGAGGDGSSNCLSVVSPVLAKEALSDPLFLKS